MPSLPPAGKPAAEPMPLGNQAAAWRSGLRPGLACRDGGPPSVAAAARAPPPPTAQPAPVARGAGGEKSADASARSQCGPQRSTSMAPAGGAPPPHDSSFKESCSTARGPRAAAAAAPALSPPPPPSSPSSPGSSAERRRLSARASADEPAEAAPLRRRDAVRPVAAAGRSANSSIRTA
ncbi:MAG: hypothetical protein J3K34DRAFT_442733 [Monoraphidium minutum]|nr:MAG: hypothetical protein J3K34DRAFT_442733 [Monoraphidium minutum]